MKKVICISFLAFSFILALGMAEITNAQPFEIPTFDLYETLDNTPTGTASETPLPVDISSGGTLPTGTFYVVLLDSLDTTNHSLDNWSDVLQFVGGTDSIVPDPAPTTVQLFSAPAFNSLPVNDIISGIDPASFIPEVTQSSFELISSNNGVVTFDANFNVHSAEEVPEPSTFLLLGAGLAGLGLLRRRFKK